MSLIIEYISGSDFVALAGTCRALRKISLTRGSWHLSELEGNRAMTKLFTEGRNVFLTGPGGCGKSHTVRRIVAEAERRHLRVAVSSTTGISATHVDGTTLHSLFGIRRTRTIENFVATKLFRAPAYVRAISHLDILVVDEISMLGRNTLELIDYVARDYRGSNAPMGGLRVVFSGDFHQLPPVLDSMPFGTPAWDALRLYIASFGVSVRQRSDITYASLLHRVRVGKHTDHDLYLLRRRVGVPLPATGPRPTRLYPTNIEADARNRLEFEAIAGVTIPAMATDFITKKRRDEHNRVYFEPSNEISVQDARKAIAPVLYRFPEEIPLKIGAQYYLTANLNVKEGLVNGTLCIIKGIEPASANSDGIVHVICGDKETSIRRTRRTFHVRGDLYLVRRQYPLKLGYAMTIHYSQGSTLDRVEIDFSRTFGTSQAYVALSRVRSPEDLYLANLGDNSIRTSKKVLAYYREALRPETD